MQYRALVLAIVILLLFPNLVMADPPTQDGGGGTIVASGFNGPQGITIDDEGNLWVIESGLGGEEDIQYISMETGQPFTTHMGTTARIVMVEPDGEQTEVAVLPSIAASDMEMVGGARLTWLDGELYVTSGGWTGGVGDAPNLTGTVVQIEDNTITQVADMWAYENDHNLDGMVIETHPYGITVGPDGWLWIADAGANTLMRVNPDSGEIEHVATFEGLPITMPNPARNNAMETDPVPTAVAFDEDGNTYVSLLSGFPFIPGSAKVLLVTPDGEISDYATGLTMLTDLQHGPDGELYAVQFGMFTEQGPLPDAGSIVRIHEGDASEVLVSGLSFPTSITFDSEGNAFVTINGLGAPGSGAVVRFDQLTDMAGDSITASE
ncbi:MAG: ScyD/ScyE family protein [Anaerolineales bacterium]|nr:ScyD/ScyE family protein [Anaerolineales bacterium]